MLLRLRGSRNVLHEALLDLGNEARAGKDRERALHRGLTRGVHALKRMLNTALAAPMSHQSQLLLVHDACLSDDVLLGSLRKSLILLSLRGF